MSLFSTIGFSAPWVLLGLLGLPLLIWLLRAVPPAPSKRRFPGVSLMQGLRDHEQVTDRTPWWLLALRMLAAAALIIGLAGPVLNPAPAQTSQSRAPLLIVLDGSWAAAPHWRAHLQEAERALSAAQRNSRPVALLHLGNPQPIRFGTADTLRPRIAALRPQPFAPLTPLDTLPDGDFDTLWLSDGLAYEGRSELLHNLETRGAVTVFETTRPLYVMHPPSAQGQDITLTVTRLRAGQDAVLDLQAHGPDPAGQRQILAQAQASFDADATQAQAQLSLPTELRARIERFDIAGHRSAGAVSLSDDSLRQRKVALIAGTQNREGLELLSPLHYLRKALAPSAQLLEGALLDLLPANPDTIILADVARLAPAETEALEQWIQDGGTLLRFAGPRLAASDLGRQGEDPLMPVRLRAGGRSLGGAMSWGNPKDLAPFTKDSPFFGLSLPDDVQVTSQVIAQPDPTLAQRVIAQLSDGTPLVTRKDLGRGQVVLFHVTANAQWSSLPLSGLFVQMLERLSVANADSRPSAQDLEGTTWQPLTVLDGFGRVQSGDTRASTTGQDLLDAPLGPNLLPGVYQSDTRALARNVVGEDTQISPSKWPAHIPVRAATAQPERPLAGWVLGAALLALGMDILASLALAGRLTGAALGALVLLGLSPRADAQEDILALVSAQDLYLAHVLTGDQELDALAAAGLRGLSDTLFYRTSVEPAAPVGVDLERNDLAVYPLLYWPISPDQPIPSAEAYARLNTYLRSGGMILFDTRDADVAGFGAGTAQGRKLQQLAAQLDIPPLSPVPADHVLTRAFYLLNDFPGRYTGQSIWVEAAPADAEQVAGMPFRDLNDNVTPVVIGGNDWASAWAVNDRGLPMVRLGSGYDAERQREIAYRFGVNLVMYVLTGNYKSDQVHVPALLDRLGQ
jgi:hypothetical protein